MTKRSREVKLRKNSSSAEVGNGIALILQEKVQRHYDGLGAAGRIMFLVVEFKIEIKVLRCSQPPPGGSDTCGGQG